MRFCLIGLINQFNLSYWSYWSYWNIFYIRYIKSICLIFSICSIWYNWSNRSYWSIRSYRSNRLQPNCCNQFNQSNKSNQSSWSIWSLWSIQYICYKRFIGVFGLLDLCYLCHSNQSVDILYSWLYIYIYMFRILKDQGTARLSRTPETRLWRGTMTCLRKAPQQPGDHHPKRASASANNPQVHHCVKSTGGCPICFPLIVNKCELCKTIRQIINKMRKEQHWVKSNKHTANDLASRQWG